ncbi:MAG: hypothetical protein PHC62_04275 [Candidatus Izemoplasmatales bacterium]|jgi:hypothetical protein|nr:hypothetical protein [Candidatus Izemoplasmatales bacterium]
MKKWLIIVAFFYLILGFVYIVTLDKNTDFIHFITIAKETSQVLFPDDHLFIDLYISDIDRFVSNIDNINDVYIEGDNSITEVDIVSIDQRNDVYTYDNNDYYLLVIEIDFNSVQYENSKLQFKNAKLLINFSNSISFKLPIGSMNLYFINELNSSPFDINKMKGIFDENDSFAGILIEFDKLMSSTVMIVSIDLFMSSVHADTYNIKEIPTDNANTDKLNELVRESSSYSLADCPYEISENSVLYIPFIKTENNFQFNRFPLIIHYIYLGKESEFVMDDFLFYSVNSMNLEAFRDELIITHYYVGSR